MVCSGNATAANDSSLSEQGHFLRLPNYLFNNMSRLWKWSQRDSLTLMSSEGSASRKTLVKMSRHCREVAWRALINCIQFLCSVDPVWLFKLMGQNSITSQRYVQTFFCKIASVKICIIPMIKRAYYFFDVVSLYCVTVMRTGSRSSREYRRLLYFTVKE